MNSVCFEDGVEKKFAVGMPTLVGPKLFICNFFHSFAKIYFRDFTVCPLSGRGEGVRF